MTRPTIDETLLRMAYVMSLRGTCSRRYVGAIIADTRGVALQSGYNGALSGFDHCPPHTDFEPCRQSEHAERNALYFAARRGVAVEGATMYCTDSPCVSCARGMIQAGIARVVYCRPYREDQGLLLLMAANIPVHRLEIDALSLPNSTGELPI